MPKMKISVSSICRLLALLPFITSLQVEAQPGQQSQAVPIATYCPNFNAVLGGPGFHKAFMKAVVQSREPAGEAAVTFTVTTDNQIIDIAASEASHPAFADAAIATVRQLRCESNGQELHLKIPLAYKWGGSSTYGIHPDDIPSSDLPRVLPLIAELRTDPARFTLKTGDGLKTGSLKVLAFDANGKFLGRLRQSDVDVQPRNVLAFRNADIVQAQEPGSGYLEMSAPNWSKYGAGRAKPTVRIEITVVD
jgi:hypothetical protein